MPSVPQVVMRDVGGSYRSWAGAATLAAAYSLLTLAVQDATLTYSGSGSSFYTVPAENSNDVFFGASGNDANDGSGLTPVATVQRAMELASTTRNVWCIDSGTYSVPSSASGLTSGTSSNKIGFGPAAGCTPTFNFPTAGLGGIDWNGVNYWSFHGGASGKQCLYTGPGFGFKLGFASSTHHIQFYQLKMQMTADLGGGTNVGIIAGEDANIDYVDVIGCELWGAGASGSLNTGAVFLFSTPHCNIVGNYMHDCPTLWHFKFSQDFAGYTTAGSTSIVVRNNIFKNGANLVQHSYADYRDNLHVSCDLDIGSGLAAICGGHDAGIIHNTFHSSRVWIAEGSSSTTYVAQVQNIILKNNCFSGTTSNQTLNVNSYHTAGVNFTSDYNTWSSGDSGGIAIIESNVCSNLAALQATGHDTNSLQGTITYVGASSSIAPADWVLTGPAGALTGSETGGPTGCHTDRLLTENVA